MSNLRNYLHAIYESENGFDKVIKVPKFTSTESAMAFIKKMKNNHIADSDIVDPETGNILLEKNERKDDYLRRNKEEEEERKFKLQDYIDKGKEKGNE